MTELQLLDKELKKLNYAIHNTSRKPNATEDELHNLQTKLELKQHIRDIVAAHYEKENRV